MTKVGITGGIGSGKSVVCEVFKHMGVAVYDADSAAKTLMNTNLDLKSKLKENFGNDIFLDDGALNRKKLSDIVFADKKKLALVNSIVHPAVEDDFDAWCKNQNATYVLKEAAILFESNAHVGLNQTICVVAPIELRVQRVMLRDNVSREKVLSIVNAQQSDEEIKSKCDFVITNDGQTALLPQVLAIHKKLNGYMKA